MRNVSIPSIPKDYIPIKCMGCGGTVFVSDEETATKENRLCESCVEEEKAMIALPPNTGISSFTFPSTQGWAVSGSVTW